MTPKPNTYKPDVAYVDYGAYLIREQPVRHVEWECVVTWCSIVAALLGWWYCVLNLGGVIW